MPAVTVAVDEGLARLTLARPDAANTIDDELARDLRSAVVSISMDRSVRAVLLTGEGRIFCGGGDLRAFREAGDGLPALIADTTIDLHAALSRMAKLEAPIVAAVQGAAGGAGLSLVAAADRVVAGESAAFRMGYTAAGLAPDGSSSFYLARVVGLRRAMDLALTNRTLDAATAESWGLVNRVVPDDRVAEEGEALARRLVAGPRVAQAEAKRLLVRGATSALEEAMERESLAITRASATPDAREGIAAFLDKREPRFDA
ncbi:MAG: enoyl-CoA hydratase-related protein [Acidimicrobiia bacterium]|nr:enoyl-CoA hydratase-related protein [Acidimicrobiia bacterium]